MGEMAQVTPYWSGRSVLVTGGTGFIGTGLVRALLARGADVHVFALPLASHMPFSQMPEVTRAITYHVGDIRSAPIVRMAVMQARPDVVFHLAALSQVREAARMPREAFEVNAMGTANLLDALAQPGFGPPAMTVIASSDKAFGHGFMEYWASGDAEHPVHPYDVSKMAGDLIAGCYRLQKRLPIRILRTGNIFGPYDVNWDRVIPGTIRSALRDRPILIRSNGQHVREYIYLDDAVEAYLRLGEQPYDAVLEEEGAPYVLAGEAVAVLPLVQSILRKLDCKAEPEVLDIAKDENPLLRLVTGGPLPHLRMMPHTTLDRGLDLTIAWFLQWLEATRPERIRSDRGR